MEFMDILEYSLRGLRYRKLRSLLTVLGVVIGIAAIVVLIALAQGLDKAVREQITGFGTNFIQVLPGQPFSGASFGPPVFKGAIYDRDANSVRHLGGVVAVSRIVSPGYASFEYRNSTLTSIIAGIEPQAFNSYVKSVGLESGEFLRDTDHSAVVLGNSVAHTAFKDEVEVGKTLYINDLPFRVKGIINPSASFDTDIYIDIHAAREFISDTEDPDRLFAIFIITEPDQPVKPIADQVERIIANNHKVKLEDKDFSVITADSILESIGVIFGLLSVFLGFVASISLIVGSIGIANAMFTSVLERTREIGILKAVGASNSDIIKLFLTEAAMIGALGGALGIFLGWLLSLVFNAFGAPTQITLELVVFAFLLSLAVGILAGYFPSKKAAGLQPVEALRYE